MKLSGVLKIVFGLLYLLWVGGLFLTMPPEGLLETALVLVFAAAIFVGAYFFYLFLIRAILKAFRRKSDSDAS